MSAALMQLDETWEQHWPEYIEVKHEGRVDKQVYARIPMVRFERTNGGRLKCTGCGSEFPFAWNYCPHCGGWVVRS